MRFKTEEQSSDACSILGSTLAFGNNDSQLGLEKHHCYVIIQQWEFSV